MKCEKCNRQIEETFMGKLKGTYIKKKPYCPICQKNLLEKASPKEQKK